jgi:type IV secretion system protein VirB4
MINVARVIKDYQESGALHAHVGIEAALDDGTFVTKSADLARWLRFQGPDYECLDQDQLDHVAQRFESGLRTLDDSFRIYQYVFKSEAPELPFRHYINPIVEEAVAGRARYLAGKGEKLCRIENYLAIAYEGWRPRNHRTRLVQYLTEPREALQRLFSEQKTVSHLGETLESAKEFLANKVASFALQLGDFLKVEPLDSQQAFTVLRRLLNYVPHKVDGVKLKYASFVDFQACDSALECHRDDLRLDDYYVQVLTLKEPPARTFAHLLRGVSELPANYVIASEWKREPVHKVRGLIQSTRRHYFNSKASLLNFLGTGGGAPRDMLIDDGAAAVVANLGGSLEEIEVQGRYLGQFSLTLILYHKDLAVLRRSVAQAFKVFAAYDAQLTEETYNRLNAWLAVIPGNGAFNLRRLWLLNTNYADLSFLYSQSAGEEKNEHLRQEYLAIFEGSSGTPYFLNLHAKDVAHTLVLGATGAGKSFLLDFLATHLQKYDPITFIFDLGGGYESLTQAFNGAYVRIGKPGSTLKINPFSLEPTKEYLVVLCSLIKLLIESNGYRATAAEERDLYEQIENLYAIAVDQRRLFTLANILPRTLRAQLQKWVEGGPYANAFDHVEDDLKLARFQTFDFEGMEKAPDLLEALLFCVLDRANTAINEAPPSSLKVLILDEAWRFFRHPVIRAYIVEALKTWRKKNAVVILATQSSDDLTSSEMLPLVVESCPTKLFLANPGMDRDAYRRLFHLNDTETELIANLVPKQQFLLKQPGVAKVLSLNVDRKEYWIYTSNPNEVQKKRAAFERYGFQKGLEALVGGNA